MNLANETIFITGFPGFIATRLVRRLASHGARFLLLVQPAFAEKAHEEVTALIAETNRGSSDFRLLSGDITQPDLGLSASDAASAFAETTLVFHLAAIYDLAVKRDIALEVNVGGTRNVNAFVKKLKSLRQYHYVSTCYVAGKRTGRILENELKHDAGFRNYYEETKYLAELEVDALKAELPVTIHRPSVVCGDSRTGETAKYDGIYYLILYLLKWPGGLSLINIGNSDVDLNLVPVDFVVESMSALATDERAIGKTLQLADPAPLSTRELFDLIARFVAGRESRVTVPARVVETSLMLSFTPAISGLPHSAVPYFFLRQNYDTTEAQALLQPLGITCPPFDSYVETIIDYAANHRSLGIV